MNLAEQAQLDRWKTFLGKISERQKAILAEAEEGIQEIIRVFPLDPMPTENALQGIRFRMDELRQKVEKTWDEQLDDKMEGASRDREINRRDDFLQELSENWDLFHARLSADFYRNLAPLAEEGGRKDVACGTCGASLNLSTRAETVSVSCASCQAVNQVLADKASALFDGAGHAFGQEAAVPLRHAIERHRIQVERRRRAEEWSAPEPIESMDQWLAMERAYWEKYATVRGETHGRAADREFVESRVNAFLNSTLMTNQRWRRAKGI